MAIAATDLKQMLTTKSGSAGSSLTSTPAASLGKYASTTEVTDATANNLFGDISAAENEALTVDYRALFFLNDHATLTLQASKIWIETQPASGAQIAIGLDPVGVVDKDTAGAQGAEIANETTAPSGVTFSAPASFGAGLTVGDVPADDGFMVWVRRTAADGSAIDDNAMEIAWQGGTEA